jgi:1-deoxyxylulose-5-phosphate synthase
MRTAELGRTGLQVSSLGLGAAEIGFVYGIGSRTMPSEPEAIALLHRAVELGITFIDTGHVYGVSEERIGKSGIARRAGIVVATKIGVALDRGDIVSDNEIVTIYRNELESSLLRLNVDSIPLVQAHGGSAAQIRSGAIADAMERFRREGKLQHFGISTRGEEAPLAAIADGRFATIQVAYSILDQRLTQHVLPEAQRAGVGVINRSVLLKGALTPGREHLPPTCAALKANADHAAALASELGISLPALALRFAVSNPAIGTALVGTNRLENLEQAAAAVEAGPLPADVLARLHELAISDPLQVDPKHWDLAYVADKHAK